MHVPMISGGNLTRNSIMPPRSLSIVALQPNKSLVHSVLKRQHVKISTTRSRPWVVRSDQGWPSGPMPAACTPGPYWLRTACSSTAQGCTGQRDAAIAPGSVFMAYKKDPHTRMNSMYMGPTYAPPCTLPCYTALPLSIGSSGSVGCALPCFF